MKRALTVPCLLLALSFSGCASEPAADARSNAPEPQSSPRPASAQASQPTGPGRISGFVFEDKNRNGIFDASDVRLAQQLVLLTSPDRTQRIRSATTAADGSFQFDNLAENDYRVSLEIPEGFERTNDDSFVLAVSAEDAPSEVQFGVAARAR